ncbi:MAG: hypothetical protein DHS20C01_21680 [marine bacterium B5-7]|nr:MAG: hypothetical protein DHS20C01_21680 [marine bacterium B5-7]
MLPLGGPAESVKLEEIEQDPERLRTLWEAAAQRTAERTLQQLE